MKQKTSWCTEKDVLMVKPPKEYLKGVHIIKDGYGRKREVGEIDFSKISGEYLLTIMQCLEEIRFMCNYDKADSENDEDYCELTTEMEEFSYELYKAFKLTQSDMLKFFKVFVNAVSKDKQKYLYFSKVFSATCKLKYMDYDNYEYCYYNEHEYPEQEDVNHNFVGDFEFIICKKIPLIVIQKMKEIIKKDKLGFINKSKNEAEEFKDFLKN